MQCLGLGDSKDIDDSDDDDVRYTPHAAAAARQYSTKQYNIIFITIIKYCKRIKIDYYEV